MLNLCLLMFKCEILQYNISISSGYIELQLLHDLISLLFYSIQYSLNIADVNIINIYQ